MTVHAQEYWASRFASDAAHLEQRRQAGLNQAQAAADTLRQAWPEVRAIHLFGSILDERFRDHSDLDLLVDGLPARDLLDAIALAEAADLLELRDDLMRETRRLQQLVESQIKLESRLSSGSETVEAAALRLHSFYSGVERMLLLVSQVVNG